MKADDAATTLRQHVSEAIIATDPTLRERLLTEPAAYLDVVSLTAQARTETDALLRLAVAGARAAGCTWESIGTTLGMTKQAAQQRYSAASDDAFDAVPDTAGPDTAGPDTAGPDSARSDTAPQDGAPQNGARQGAAGLIVDPDDPSARVHQISWLNTFTEMKALEKAGRYGWHLIGTGSGVVIVRKSDVRWEHQRVFVASRAAAHALEEQGWLRCGSGSFPHTYFKRPTGEPALPEPADDGYLGRT